MVYATCPICDFKFQVEEEIRLTDISYILKDDGNCPNCNAHYTFDYDCEYEGAIVIADFDFYYLSSEQKQKVINEYKSQKH